MVGVGNTAPNMELESIGYLERFRRIYQSLKLVTDRNYVCPLINRNICGFRIVRVVSGIRLQQYQLLVCLPLIMPIPVTLNAYNTL